MCVSPSVCLSVFVAMCRLGCSRAWRRGMPRLQRILFGGITTFGSCFEARTWAPFGLQRIETSAACAYLRFISLSSAQSTTSSTTARTTTASMATERKQAY